jgi:hypothetical protein
MGATNFSGPLNVYNAAPNNGIGSALDYNDSGGGPSLFFAGSGIMDPRPFYQYVPGGVRGGYGWLGCPRVTIVDAVPSTISYTAIAASQAPVAGTPLTLVSTSGNGITTGVSITNAATGQTVTGLLAIDGAMSPVVFGQQASGLGSTSGTYQSIWDPTKALARTVGITSLGNDTGAVFTVKGFDVYGYPMTQAITGSAGTLASSTKAFKYIQSITPSGVLAGSNVSVGQQDTYGFMLRSDAFPYLQIYWPAETPTLISASTGYTAAVTTTATSATGDVRGTYALQSASNGIHRLTIFSTVSLADIGTSAGLVGVTQA